MFLYRCPFAVVPEDIFDTLRMVWVAKEGLWPEAGGYLDQTASFAAAYEVAIATVGDLERRESEK